MKYDGYKNKVFLVTGGTGSFGKVVVKHLIRTECDQIRVFSRDEAKQDEMREEIDDERVKYYIGDVRDMESVRRAMSGVNFVFHAAALKQVPSCEFFPMQAVMTNVHGSDNVVRAAIESNVEKVICLSTDKAVYPINAMGISKAMMEKVVQSYARTDTDTVICCVRYGNVMCSRGSVIPRFIKQISSGGPITITSPTMTRFIMALSDAVDLVDYAFEHGQQGDVLVKKSPACTISDLAEALQDIMSKRVETKIIGIRHGEKQYETLASKDELVRSKDLGSYIRIIMDDRDLNYDKYFFSGKLEEEEICDYNSDNTERLSVGEVVNAIRRLPEIRALI